MGGGAEGGCRIRVCCSGYNHQPKGLSLRGCPQWRGGGGRWHEAMVLVCLPLAAPIGPSPLLILTLCGSERVLVVSTEPPDDLSCLTTPEVGRPGDGAVARAVDQVHPDALPESMRGFADSSTDLSALGVCICRVPFLTGASLTTTMMLSRFASFCALHRFRRAWSALPCRWGGGGGGGVV